MASTENSQLTSHLVVKDGVFPHKIGIKGTMATLTTTDQYRTGGSSYGDWGREETKGIQIGKGRVNLSLVANEKIWYIKKNLRNLLKHYQN